jgi:hypothetical protein
VTAKPLLLLDIDGVVSPIDPLGQLEATHLVCRDDDLWAVASVLGRARRLLELYDVAWCSGWDPHCDGAAAALGLPARPQVPLQSAWSPDRTWKLADVDRYAQDRPLAWVDDELLADAFDWARRRHAPTLLVRPDARRGLSHAEFGELTAFASAFRATPR